MYLPRGNEGRLIGSRGYFIDCLRWKSVQYLNRRLIGLSKRGEQSVSRDVSLTGFQDRRVLARARGPLESGRPSVACRPIAIQFALSAVQVVDVAV